MRFWLRGRLTTGLALVAYVVLALAMIGVVSNATSEYTFHVEQGYLP